MKHIALLLLIISVLCFAACGGEDGAQTEGTNISSDDSSVGTEDKFNMYWTDITLLAEGETMELCGGADMSLVTFSSEDVSIATFENGIVTAVSYGTTNVSATYNGETFVCKVNCDLPKPPETTAPQTEAPATEPPVTEPPATEAPEQTVTTPEAPVISTGGARDPVLAPPATQAVGSSFFDDAVFVGDSVSLKLSYYAGSTGLLGKAKFLVRGSYGVGNAVYDKLLLTWQGVEMKAEDAIAATGSKKLFIMLGMNDIGLYGVDTTIENWGELLKRIRSKSPGIDIYIQSMTPIWTGGEKGSLSNANVNKYNEKLKSFASANGCKFIDVAPYMRDTTGGLATVYTSDQYVHVTDAGADTWIRVLKAYTGY